MIMRSTRLVLAAGAAAVGLSPFAAGVAAAQDGYYVPPSPPPPVPAPYYQDQARQARAYDDGYDQGRADQADAQDYAAPLPPPPDYDGRQLPPPPPGYDGPGYSDAWSSQDDSYAHAAEDWAQRYCVRSGGDVGAGAAIGGVLGAIIGSGLGGRHDHTGGAIAGAVVGAAGGAAIASSSSGETSPGCPPGYVVRRDAVTFSYAPTDYYYAAPGWYRPWVFVDQRWVYRPYPYHVWYYHHYRGPWHGGYRGGWHGGYRGGWHDHRR